MRTISRIGYSFFSCIFMVLMTYGWGMASHNVAGDITYTYISGNTVRITLTTYTDPAPASVDRCEADLEIWAANAAPGDTALEILRDIPRINGPLNVDPLFPNSVTCPGQAMGEYIVGTIKKNVYSVTYTFNGPGKYLVRYYDQARIDYVNNINNSGTQAFFIESTIFLSPLFGFENSPQFLNHPIDFACIDKVWTHNPGGYDPDPQDVLMYTLVECRQYDPPNIPNPIITTGFQFPGQFGTNGPMVMDPNTGLITWTTPQVVGWYNLAYKVEEFRNGILIGETFRDMAVLVKDCDNNPPIIETITDTCVFAGDTLRFDVIAYDPDNNPPTRVDSIYFYLNNNNINNNGPFAVANSPATIDYLNPIGAIPPDYPITPDPGDSVIAEFEWATLCEHLKPQFYQVDFYAHDNLGYRDSTANLEVLSVHKIVKITVLPRPVEGLTLDPRNGEIELNWLPHGCDSVLSYEIYRGFGTSSFLEDSVCCGGDPTTAGFTLIGSNDGNQNVTFVDDNDGERFPVGTDICYLVRGVTTTGEFTCATNVECIEVDNDFAILLKDSINITAQNGSIAVAWSQPKEIDTLFFPRPYTYTLNRADDINGPLVWTQIASNLNFSDTTFMDVGMDTEARGYRYRIDTYDANGDTISPGNMGSSIYLSITPGDEELTLSWNEFVPWFNRIYYIFRADDFGGAYTLIDSVPGTGGNTHTYLDTGLENFEDYCYVIISEGEYFSPDFPDSVRNASQKVCAIPQDFTPPCVGSIVFDTTRDCQALTLSIEWNEPDSICGADVDYYTVYFADNREATFVPIAQIDSGVGFFSPGGLTSIADCYGITATDTSGNESEMIVFCFENCPTIELSNVFSPNGDGINDFFSPITDRSIRVTEVLIYDRWGNIVYSSNSIPNADQLWDGRTNDGREVPEGVFYYLVRYEEDRLPFYVPKRPLVGHVNLLR